MGEKRIKESFLSETPDFRLSFCCNIQFWMAEATYYFPLILLNLLMQENVVKNAVTVITITYERGHAIYVMYS